MARIPQQALRHGHRRVTFGGPRTDRAAGEDAGALRRAAGDPRARAGHRLRRSTSVHRRGGEPGDRRLFHLLQTEGAYTAKWDAAFTEGPVLGSADLHMLLLGAAGNRDEDKEMLGAVDEALREDPAQPEAIVARARADKSSPLPLLRKSVAARPGDWRAWLLLGTALGDGSGEEKEAAYRKAVALNPDSASAHETLARYLLSRGRAKEALPMANRALDLVPADENSVDTLAGVAGG